jgi:hypothetical protein
VANLMAPPEPDANERSQQSPPRVLSAGEYAEGQRSRVSPDEIGRRSRVAPYEGGSHDSDGAEESEWREPRSPSSWTVRPARLRVKKSSAPSWRAAPVAIAPMPEPLPDDTAA